MNRIVQIAAAACVALAGCAMADEGGKPTSQEPSLAAAGSGAQDQPSGRKFYREGLSGVDFTGLDEARKERALKILNENGCTCGCGMTIAQCRVEDKTCPRSPGLAAAVVEAIKGGKSDAETLAALKAAAPPPQPPPPPPQPPAAAAQGPPPPAEPVPSVAIDVAGSPSKGPEAAKVTVVAFEEFQWPYCSRAAPVLKQILETWPNDVKVVFKHFPLAMHQRARPASLAAAAAHKQGKFWEFEEIVFANQRALDDASLRSYAEKAGLDIARYDKDIADPETARIVDKDMQDGNKAGVRGTPTFFVNGVQSPVWSFDTMKVLLDEAVKGGDVSLAAGKARAQLMGRMQANRPAPPDPNKVWEIDVAGAPVRGLAGAKVTIVAFSDYQWPHCAGAEPLLKQILEAYPKDARLVAKQFPLSFHPNARPAAEAALFAQKHGKYWEMNDLLFQNARQLTMENLRSFARQLGLDEAALEESVKSEAFKAVIDKDMADGQKAGVNGTPTLFVNGKRVMVRDFANIKRMIDEALGTAATPDAPASK